MNNKPAHRPLTLRIAIFTLALWLAAMALLTWIVAADMQRQLRNDANDHVARYAQRAAISGDTSQRPLSLKLLEQLGYPYVNLRFDKLLPFALPHTDAISSSDPLWGNWKAVYGFEAAEIFSESETGSIVAKTDNFATFQWFSENSWQSQDSSAPAYGYAIVSDEAANIFPGFPSMACSSLLFSVLRMRGHFEGDQFIPISIDSGHMTSMDTEADAAKIMACDASNTIIWSNQYTTGSNDPNAITIYCTDVRSYQSPLTEAERSVQAYPDIAEAYLAGAFTPRSDLLCTHLVCEDTVMQDGQPLRYTLLVRAWPLEYAAMRLWPAYLVSLPVMLLAAALLLWVIRRRKQS